MARQKQLPPRLKALADWVPQGAKVVDVGCDHGYLPVFLLQNGQCDQVIASDIREGPLRSAQNTATRYGLNDQIQFIQCDGLTGIAPDQVDTIVIAGMGGETIIDILEYSPWTNQKTYRLLLQPMSKGELLRAFLYRNGYEIMDETLRWEPPFLYSALCVQGGGEKRMPTPEERHVSAALKKKRDDLLKLYLERTVHWLSDVKRGLEQSKDPEAKERLSSIEQELTALQNIREEL